MTVRVQEADFDLGAELLALRAADSRVGALASFLGLVRDMNDGASVAEMTLEHYPGMTEKALEEIVVEARGRWDIY
ncbi:MAG: molybdenum cofactor biosynthesis protein MoaE, partial [Azonexus sp.]|nr:molybdenum cofactor biosynthesis protein MoaE [Azonexus sp.]